MGEQSSSRGRLVGRYVVHDRIAAGGMATVHVGRLLGAAGFSRTVAIKRLHDCYAKDPDFVAMLLDEARLAASIRHPNVVPTLDVVAEDDELLVVMEYVEGDSVAHLTKLVLDASQRVPIAFAAAIVAQALHGLHAAHETRDKNGDPLGIVHRDVSPQNILVGIDGVSRVLDFGIAKAASRSTATEDGQIKGKTAYMVPEQLQHGSVDRRTDIFAASVVLWELLCGKRLFFADSPGEMMSRVLTGPIDPPQMHAPGLPPALAAITMRGLERDASRRFATAEEMALAIEESIAMPRSKDIGAWVSTTAKLMLEGRAQLVQVVEKSSHKMPAAAVTSDPALARAIEEAERRRQHADMATDVGGRVAGSAEHHGASPPSAPQHLPFGGYGHASTPSQPGSGSAPGSGGYGYAPAPPPSGSGGVYSSRPMMQLGGPPRMPGEESTGLVHSTSHSGALKPPPSRAAIALAIAGGSALLLAVGVVLVMARSTLQPKTDPSPPAAATIAEPAPIVTTPSSTAVAPSSQPTASGSVPPALTTTPPPTTTRPPTTTQPTRRPPPPVAATKKHCEIPFVVDAKGQKHFKPECVVE